jgi:hypothetical protein
MGRHLLNLGNGKKEGRNVLSNEFPITAKTNKQTNKNLDLNGKDTKTQST